MKDLFKIKVGDTLDSVIKRLNTPTRVSKIYDNLEHLVYTWEHNNITINIVILANVVLSIEYYERNKRK